MMNSLSCLKSKRSDERDLVLTLENGNKQIVKSPIGLVKLLAREMMFVKEQMPSMN